MTEEQLKAFLTKAQADHTLQNKLSAAKTHLKMQIEPTTPHQAELVPMANRKFRKQNRENRQRGQATDAMKTGGAD